MNLKWMFLASVFAVGSATSLPAEAAEPSPCESSIPAELQASIKGALQRISTSSSANATLTNAVKIHNPDVIRSLLVANGVDASALNTIAIDAGGAGAGPRKAEANTIYFALGTSTGQPTAQGLVYMGRPYGWVDWNTFDPWAYF
ncbi:hypothetical protein [Pyxidicoccus sp. MSG2]|uniref:hypothetical protein n=1 Tax=Pyxidicoccus sp. MSG2 TaxID=2996790 RepID=UPI00226F8335|nr:hypothetical protein [Pyxidicoccus sp. MSG2]MCY1023274.1 hypothetical protein [Pyxidicoccus sp. MSG2]